MAFRDEETNHTRAIVGGAFGIAFGQLVGSSLVVPLLAAWLGGFAVSRIRPSYSRSAVIALGLLFGHASWMVLGMLALPAMMDQVLLDVIAAVLLLAALLWRLSKFAMGALIALEVISVGFNLVMLASASQLATIGALIAHIAIRGAIAFYMVKVWRETGRGSEHDPSELAEAFE